MASGLPVDFGEVRDFEEPAAFFPFAEDFALEGREAVSFPIAAEVPDAVDGGAVGTGVGTGTGLDVRVDDADDTEGVAR